MGQRQAGRQGRVRAALCALGAAGALALGAQGRPAWGADGQAPAADLVPMGPGEVIGALNTYPVKPGDSVSRIAARNGVHPVRVTVPKGAADGDGEPKAGARVLVDQRVIRPRFQDWVDGIVLNLPEAELYYVSRGEIVRHYPVAVSMSDWKMPVGQTSVKEKEKNPTWHVPPKIQKEMAEKGLEVKTKVPPGPKNPLGARWIGVWDQTYGFHGTIAPESLKRYASHGCVRMLNPDVIDLFDRVSLGTPVRIYYQPVLLAVEPNGPRTVWLTVYPDIYHRDYDYAAAVKALAAQAHVSDRLDWAFVKQAIEKKNGILTSVSRLASPAPTQAEAAPRGAAPAPAPRRSGGPQ